jgi:hypothetical protein
MKFLVQAGILLVAVLHATPLSAAVDFNRDIRPLISDRCILCHGPAQSTRKAGLRLDVRAEAIQAGALIPGKPDESALIQRVFSVDADERMPPAESHKSLSASEKQLLRDWITEGAKYAQHWAFTAPVARAFPRISGRPMNAIDGFVLRKLQQHKLDFTSRADPATQIRRVSLDLTGLPPTPDEVDTFLKDKSSRAYENLVDRLLSSKRYGERMALDWMDAARYGDTSVMHADGNRDMWPWRDYVIDSFNNNLPFDQFTIEQLAGDLLPNATVQQKVASGFNRNHATSDEGGAIAEELRVEYVVDRVKTTSTVWLALTMECSQCHDHKYDPISQEDYYRFYAYFNNTTDPGMQTRRGNQTPVVDVPTMDQEKRLIAARGNLAHANKQLNDHKTGARPALEAWLAKLKTGDPQALPQPSGLAHQFEFGTEEKFTDAIVGTDGRLQGDYESTVRSGKNRAVKLAGKTQIVFTNGPTADFKKSFTFAGWIKSSGKGSGAIFSQMENKDYRGFDFWQQGRSIGTHIVNKWPDNGLKVVSKNSIPENKWTHVVLTYNGSLKAAGVKIYINGKLSPNKIEKNTLKEATQINAPFRIGSRGSGSHFTGELADLRIYNKVLSETELGRIGQNLVGRAFAKDPKKRNAKERGLIDSYYYETQDRQYPALAEAAETRKQTEGKVKAEIVTCMIMQDNPKTPRMTYVLNRGQYDQPNKERPVKPGVPASLGALPLGAPDNRLGLAQWLTKPDHPLTSRVAVNRTWTMLFGEGLVSTPGDFGNQGAVPSHPQLLDWLAVDFVQNGWNVKRLIRQIVLADTYRQNSRVSDKLLHQDPQNRLFSRGPRFRLQGEFIRDLALSASGLLNGEIGGPGVKPYQPPNIWNEVALNGGLRYKADAGGKLYRRSMYSYWRRSSPLPNMLIFDVPTREKCIVKRPRTNTPLQALVTLNDPQFVEAARVLAQRLITERTSTESRIRHAYKLVTARDPNSREIAILTDTLEEQLKDFTDAPEKTREYLSVGEHKRDEKIDPAEHAAWSVISQLILNLDEALTRG